MNSRISILHLLDARPNSVCGVEKNLLYFFEKSARRDFENIIVYPADGYSKTDFLTCSSVYYPLKVKQKLDFSGLVFLRKLIRKHRIDFIHSYSYNLDFIGGLLSVLTAKPHIVRRPVDLSWCYFWGRWKRMVYQGVDRRVLNRAAKVVVCSQAGKTKLLRDYGLSEERVSLIYNGVDLQKYQIANPPAPVGKTITVVGQLSEYKGHRHLFYAFREVVKNFASLKLIVVGDGILRKDLEKLAQQFDLEKQIVFLGTRDDIPAIMSFTDIFVLPSLREGIPLAMLEAMAAAKPVIVTRVGGIPEIITDGENGLLVPSGDVPLLCSAIKSLLSDPLKARRLGERARELIEKKYTLDKTVQATEEMYRQVWRQRFNQ